MSFGSVHHSEVIEPGLRRSDERRAVERARGARCSRVTRRDPLVGESRGVATDLERKLDFSTRQRKAQMDFATAAKRVERRTRAQAPAPQRCERFCRRGKGIGKPQHTDCRDSGNEQSAPSRAPGASGHHCTSVCAVARTSAQHTRARAPRRDGKDTARDSARPLARRRERSSMGCSERREGAPPGREVHEP